MILTATKAANIVKTKSPLLWWNRLAVCAALLSGVAGCAGRGAAPISRPDPTPQANYEYVELQPGWRIKVITPILKSGKFIVETQAVTSADGTVQLKLSDDFVGYEIAYYSISEQRGGVLIRYSSSQMMKEGKPVAQTRPLLPLFDLPPNLNFVRLMFLTRVSKADHSQGILAASSPEHLTELTQSVEAHPEENCKSSAETFCSWVPAGITAQVEKRDPAHRNQWLSTW
jgi:hypothetical protein